MRALRLLYIAHQEAAQASFRALQAEVQLHTAGVAAGQQQQQ